MKNETFKYQTDVHLTRLLKIIGIVFYFTLMCWFLSSCERRELYVYGDNFESVELKVDWRQYAEKDPGGMTVWFYPMGEELGKPYRTTTANVNQQSLYLPGGLYRGVIIDYSPEEYSDQRFLDLDDMWQARTEAKPARYQPDVTTISAEGVTAGMNDTINSVLYSDVSWPDKDMKRPRHSIAS